MSRTDRAPSRHRTARGTAALGALGLLITASAWSFQPARAAESPAAESPAAAAGQESEARIADLPADATYTLSPQLAAMLGRTTVDAAGLQALRAAVPALPGDKTPPVGTTLLWPALDGTKESVAGIYLKQYTLRGVGDKIEVWVASGSDGVSTGTAFPAGDCRNAVAHTTDITDAQVQGLIHEFDATIYPRETKAFSTPPDHAGVATIPGLTAAGLNFAGDGDHTVTLVDNVRDPNFYDFPANASYIAGFYAPIFNELTDRNVMTIDAFDWLHRTGAHPPNEPNADLCKSRPARPFTYESTFGHEWQHLLQQYVDPDETTWVNEGLSMFAESLDGYSDARLTVHQTGGQGNIHCFQGYGIVKGVANPNPRPCGGAQNSLTSWGDEGEGSEILADYGNAWSFMLFLYDRYGLGFMSALHRDGGAQGLAGVQAQLDTFAKGTKVEDVLHDFQVMNLVDSYVDTKGGTVTGIARKRVTSPSLNSSIYLANPASYALPGAAPNGADYVVLKQGGTKLSSVGFTGDRTVIAPKASGDPTAALFDASGSGAAPVSNWHVSLVGIDKAHHKVLVRGTDNAFSLSLSAKDLKAFAAYPLVVAVISHDDPEDLNTEGEQYAAYSLSINGTKRDGD